MFYILHLQISQLTCCSRAHEEFASLCEIVEPVYPKSNQRSAFIEETKSGAFDGVKAIYGTNKSVGITGPFDAELLDILPKSLKFICHNGEYFEYTVTRFTK